MSGQEADLDPVVAGPKALAARLRELAPGREVWRVADPDTGAYCVAFGRTSGIQCLNPERAAREWVADHRARFPKSQHAHYEARCVHERTDLEMAALQAADMLDPPGEALGEKSSGSSLLPATGDGAEQKQHTESGQRCDGHMNNENDASLDESPADPAHPNRVVAWLRVETEGLATQDPPCLLGSSIPKGYRATYRAVVPAETRAERTTFEASFERWWAQHGQFCRAGGGNYEKTFAYRAAEHYRGQTAGCRVVPTLSVQEIRAIEPNVQGEAARNQLAFVANRAVQAAANKWGLILADDPESCDPRPLDWNEIDRQLDDMVQHLGWNRAANGIRKLVRDVAASGQTYGLEIPLPAGAAERPAEVGAAAGEAEDLLRIFQSHLGSSRASCDEPGKVLWDRIEAVLGTDNNDRPRVRNQGERG